MQVGCKVYGLANTSLGIDCALDRDLLAVGKCFPHHNRVYVIISVVESQGQWYANVIPEDQCQHLRRPLPRFQGDAEQREQMETWRQRVVQAELQAHKLQEIQAQYDARLDRLLGMLELLTKEPDVHPHEPSRPGLRR